MATTDDWKRFVVNAPQAMREYRTIEIYHPQLSQVYRFVSNYIDVDFTLESAAPRNSDEAVTFLGITMRVIEPSEREDSEQSLSISFGNVDGAIHEIIDQINGSGFVEPIEAIYRKYYSGDLSQPAVPALYLYGVGIGFDGPKTVNFTAEDADLSQKRSGSIYTLEAFPGLRE